MAISEVVSIEITDFNTKVCEISYNKKTPNIHQTLMFDNPERTVEDAFIIDKSRYGSELRTQLKNAGIRSKDVVFVLTSNKIISREVTIPDMKDKNIQDYIEGEKESYFPMDISAHKLSYCILDRNNETNELRLSVYAAPEMLIKNYSALAKELDFKVIAMDYAGNAEYQWLHMNAQFGMDFYLEINEFNTMFTILENGRFALQRNMNFGSQTLAQHLADEEYYKDMNVVQAKFKLTEINHMFASYSELMEYMPQDEEDARLYECKKRLTDAVRPLISDFSRVLEYYNTKNRDAKISKVYVGGCGSKVKGLMELVMSEFEGIEFIRVETLPNIKYSKYDNAMLNNSTEFLACIGASHFTLDFSKVEAVEDKKNATGFAFLAFGLTIFACIVLVAIPLISYWSGLSSQKSLNAQINELKSFEELKAEENTKTAKLNELQKFDASTITNNEDWNLIAEQIEALMPTNAVVSSLSSNELGVTMVVTTTTKLEVAKLLLQLRTIENFSSVSIGTVTETTDEESGVTVESFTITCSFPPKDGDVAPNADAAPASTAASNDAKGEE